MFTLTDKVAIVTGGASGIGLATVKVFVEKGAIVVRSDINSQVGKQQADSLAKMGQKMVGIRQYKKLVHQYLH